MGSFALDERAIAAGYRVESFPTVASTSTEGCEHGRAGEGGPVWFVTDHQVAGRGRRGRTWAALPPGNLAASLLTTMSAPPGLGATLGFVAGVAAIRALDACCGAGARLRLKWPNDILLDGCKLAGILLETEQRRDGSRFVVVGIGVNVLHAPTGLPYQAASLAGAGFDVTAGDLFRALSATWVETVAIWDDGRNFAEIRRLWLERAAGLGENIVVRNGDTSLGGTFETLDVSGQLVLRLPDGSVRGVTAGDIHFGLAATVRSGAVG